MGCWLCSPKKNLSHFVSIVWNAFHFGSPWSCTSDPTLCSLPAQQHESNQKRERNETKMIFLTFTLAFFPSLFLCLFNFLLNPSQGLPAYVMSLNICAILQEVRHAKTVQNVPLCTPTEVGQMASLVLSLVNCLWQERWRIRSWTRAMLTRALQTVVDTVPCTPVPEVLSVKTI